MLQLASPALVERHRGALDIKQGVAPARWKSSNPLGHLSPAWGSLGACQRLAYGRLVSDWPTGGHTAHGTACYLHAAAQLSTMQSGSGQSNKFVSSAQAGPLVAGMSHMSLGTGPVKLFPPSPISMTLSSERVLGRVPCMRLNSRSRSCNSLNPGGGSR